MIKNKDLVSEISNELAIAILVEKRHSAKIDETLAKDFIERVKCELAKQNDDKVFEKSTPNSGLGVPTL